MNEPVTLPRDLPEGNALSYDFLRSEGVQLLQQLAGDTWTDHNLHDPGITILEQLCYALTELAYRIDLPIPDLLGRAEGDAYRHLYGPAALLTTQPVTPGDIRKVVIDVPGVKNAWVEKVAYAQPALYYDRSDLNLHLFDGGDTEPVQLLGLYRVTFEQHAYHAVNREELIRQVNATLQATRPLCVDYEAVTLLGSQEVQLHGRAELGEVDDVHRVAATVLYQVAAHLSPMIPFYTLPQLLERGRTMEEIFDGPALKHGFIDDAELARYDRRSEVQVSDVVREIMDVTGIKVVHELSLSSGQLLESWLLELDPDKTPRLALKESLNTFVFEKQGLPVRLNAARVEALFLEMQEADRQEPPEQALRDRLLPEPEAWDLSGYHSIQYQFPATYGLGEHVLPESSSVSRKAQVLQLTAYLTFFEQVLGNYLVQLDGFKDLMSFSEQNGKAYFHRSLIGQVPNLEKVVASREAYEDALESMSLEKLPGERKNRLLNHLLARFGESLSEYSILQHELVGQGEEVLERLIRDKAAFLRDYLDRSGTRGTAFDPTKATWNTTNVSGLEKRIAGKLGIHDYTRRPLAQGTNEGFHMVEHLLLRPVPDDLRGYQDVMAPKRITGFEQSPGSGNVTCTSPAHGLQTGERILIKGSNGYDGAYVVNAVGQNEFSITLQEAPVDGATLEGPLTWERTQVDTRYLVLTRPVTFSNAGDGTSTRCTAKAHGLAAGDRIHITGAADYHGIYTITNPKVDTFDIAAPFTQQENGRWMWEGTIKDPYSLQLTFVLPEWAGRFTNANFRQFTEKTIREETPAHLTVYVQWLNEQAMSVFDTAYQHFLSALQNQ